MQNALAQSSNTAFTDLTHRVTTSNVIRMAAAMGVNITCYPLLRRALTATGRA